LSPDLAVEETWKSCASCRSAASTLQLSPDLAVEETEVGTMAMAHAHALQLSPDLAVEET